MRTDIVVDEIRGGHRIWHAQILSSNGQSPKVLWECKHRHREQTMADKCAIWQLGHAERVMHALWNPRKRK